MLFAQPQKSTQNSLVESVTTRNSPKALLPSQRFDKSEGSLEHGSYTTANLNYTACHQRTASGGPIRHALSSKLEVKRSILSKRGVKSRTPELDA